MLNKSQNFKQKEHKDGHEDRKTWPNYAKYNRDVSLHSLFLVLVTLVIHLDPLGSTRQGLYLSECQLLVSDPGAVNQMWHCDAWLTGDKTNVKAGGYTFTFTDICMSTGLEK